MSFYSIFIIIINLANQIGFPHIYSECVEQLECSSNNLKVRYRKKRFSHPICCHSNPSLLDTDNASTLDVVINVQSTLRSLTKAPNGYSLHTRYKKIMRDQHYQRINGNGTSSPEKYEQWLGNQYGTTNPDARSQTDTAQG
jgi:hypothetical protein